MGLNFYTGYPCLISDASQRSVEVPQRILLGWIPFRHNAVGGLEIGRIYMGNYAGLALEILKWLLRRYDPAHGVIYVVVFTH